MAHTLTPGEVVYPTREYAEVSNYPIQAGIVQSDTCSRSGQLLPKGYVVVLWVDGRRWMEFTNNLLPLGFKAAT